jgi:SMODS-associating 4TM effector domain
VVGQAPIELARIVCQRSNLWYDTELRRRYGAGIIFGAIILVSLLVLLGVVQSLTLVEMVAAAFVPAAPVLIWALRECLRQRDAADANERVKEAAEVFSSGMTASTIDSDLCLAQSRSFQDAIFGRRATNPLVFPWLYRILRKGLEVQMNIGAAEWLRRAGVSVSE